jgi:sulfur dioxygenase
MEAYRQFFDTASSTFTYLLVDPETRNAVIIDPVDTHLDDYLDVVAREKLALAYVVETHAHADHVTSA